MRVVLRTFRVRIVSTVVSALVVVLLVPGYARGWSVTPHAGRTPAGQHAKAHAKKAQRPKAHTPPKHRRATHKKTVAVHKTKTPATTSAPTSAPAPVAAPAPAPSTGSSETYVEPTGVV